jgi:hypothetical protein
MAQAALLVGTIVIPVALFLLNVILRSGRGIPQSTAADVLLLLPAFDAGILLDTASFQKLVADQGARDYLGTFSTGSLVVCLLFWGVAVIILEKQLLSYYDLRRNRYTSRWFLLPFFSSWIIAAFAIAAHILIFTYHFPVSTKG